MPSQTRILFDARGLMLHAYHAAKDRQPIKSTLTGKDIPTAASGMLAFIDMYIKPALRRVAPINLVAVWEGGSDRRRILFSGYKASGNSEDADPQMKEQVDLLMVAVKKLLAGLGALQVYTPKVEADDTLAYLCERLDGYKIVQTVDGDLLQLQFCPNTVVSGPHIKDPDFFKGYPAKYIALYKSIIGDKSDEYAGVTGLGEGFFKELVEEVGYDGLDELEKCVADNDFTTLFDAVQEEGSKLLTKLYVARDQWRQSYLLARLHPEWCEWSFGNQLIRPTWLKRLPSRERIIDAFESINLTKTVPDWCVQYMPTQTGIDADTFAKVNWVDVQKQCRGSENVGFDYESYDSVKHPQYREAGKGNFVDVLAQRVTGASYCFGPNYQHSIYASLLHRDTKNLSEDQFLSVMDACIGDAVPIAQNNKFEQVLSKTNFGITFPKIYDTAIMASYVDEEMEQHLKGMSKRLLNYSQKSYGETVPEGKDMRDISLDEVLGYGCDDAFVTAHLFVLFKIILECERTWDFVDKYEVNFDALFVDSYIRGVPVDLDYLSALSATDDARYDTTYTKLCDLLTQHCLERNEDGFHNLWADLEEFHLKDQEAKAQKKEEGIDQDKVDQHMENKRQELWEACAYVPLQQPTHMFAPFTKTALTATARAIGLAGIRVTDPAKLLVWTAGMAQQSIDNATPLTVQQQDFIGVLEDAALEAQKLKLKSVFTNEALIEFCRKTLYADPAFWEGDELSMRSPKQVAELLYGKMGLPILLRNEDKTGEKARTRYDMPGAPSTSEIAIRTAMMQFDIEDLDLEIEGEDEEKLPWQVKVLLYILRIRRIDQRRSLYYKPYPLWASGPDGRLHPSIRNCGTKTRRPSGSSPNILQVSKQEGAEMRGVVLPLPESEMGELQVLVSVDFVQQELVILAGESGDANLRACYIGDNKRDVHSSTASALMKISYDEYFEKYKAKDRRAVRIRKKLAKTVNFLMAYGGSAVGLARKAVISQERADESLNAYFDNYPGVKDYQQRMETLALRHGFVTDCFGNRKHCDGIYSDNKRQQRALARQAGNQPIQGGAASVLKVACTKIRERDVLGQTGATLIAPIYDEILASVPVSQVVRYIRLMEDCMEMELPGLDIGLETSVSIGRNWSEASTNELGTHPSEEAILFAVDKIVSELTT